MAEDLRSLAEGLWTAERPHGFFGIDVGGRMNVIRLPSGGLMIHSPVSLTEGLKEGLARLGEVKYVAAPNRFHHIHIGDYVRAYPDAMFLAAPGLPEKRRDIPFSGLLGGDAPHDWEGVIEHFVFGGMPLLNEAVFFHKPSHTLILTDLLFNFSEDLTVGQKVFTALEGGRERPSVSRLMRYFLIKDKAAVRRSADKVLGWGFDLILLAHKDIIEKGGREAFRLAYEGF
jgi:Domain of unknown function (DUF4336)